MRLNASFVKLLDRKIYFFAGSKYFRYDISSDRTDSGYPLDIKDNWKGLWPEKIDAAFNLDLDKVYFFRGGEYALYSLSADKVSDGYPRPIKGNWKGLWADNLDAAVNWNNGKAYFFKGSEYIRYDLAADRADQGYPKPINQSWKGVWSEGIDTVVNFNSKKAYFFKGDEYIRYDVASDQADPGYPLPIADFWLGLAPLKKTTAFDPAKHGFHFANSFEINPRLFGVTDLKSWGLGLCGGMCLAALDRFNAHTPIPALDHPPAQKCPELDLFWELFGRLVVTLFPVAWLRIAQWQITPEADYDVPSVTSVPTSSGQPLNAVPTSQRMHGIGYSTTHEEWPKLKAALDQAKPTILCLVRQKDAEDPSKNHQVLAIGYQMDDIDHLKIQIYDPNHPDKTEELQLELGRADHSINGNETDGKAFRGFFVITKV